MRLEGFRETPPRLRRGCRLDLLPGRSSPTNTCHGIARAAYISNASSVVLDTNALAGVSGPISKNLQVSRAEGEEPLQQR